MATREEDLPGDGEQEARADPGVLLPQSVRREDYEAALRAQLRGEEPLPRPEPEDPEGPEEPEEVGFFRSVWDTTKEIGRSATRGVVKGAITAPLDTAGEITGLEWLEAPDDKFVPAVLGEKSENGLAAFLEDTLQFGSAFVGAGKAKWALKLGKAGGAVFGSARAAQIAKGAAAGAYADFAAMDLEEDELAEMMADSEIPGVQQVGEVFDVDEGDSPLVGRLKRTAFGLGLGVGIDYLAHSYRAAKAAEALENSSISKESAEKAREVMEESGEILDQIKKGEYDNGQPVQVRPTEDGAWKLKNMKEGADGPRYDNRGEAEAQAGTMNEALQARDAKGRTITNAQTAAVREEAQNILKGVQEGDEKAIAAVTEGTHFNVSTFNDPDETLAVIDGVSQVIRDEFQVAMKAGGEEVKETYRKAIDMIGGVGEDEMAEWASLTAEEFEDAAARLLAGNLVLRDLANQAGKAFVSSASRPHDAVAFGNLKRSLKHLFEVGPKVAGANSETGRALNILRHRGRNDLAESLSEQASKEGEEAVSAADAGPGGAEGITPSSQEGAGSLLDEMSEPEIRAIGQMVDLAEEPKNLFAVGDAVRIVQKTGRLDRAQEYFVNNLLSGPVTWGTVAASGVSVSLYEPVIKVLAGAATLNKAQVREGADLLYGLGKYAGDGLRAMKMAFQAGHTFIGRQPTTAANLQPFSRTRQFLREKVPGARQAGDAVSKVAQAGAEKLGIRGTGPEGAVNPGDAIRTSTRVMLSMDEAIKVTNYRAFVRAKALREGRSLGLSGQALEEHAEKTVQAAFDKDTGIALYPEGMEYATEPTMANPLRPDTPGGLLAKFVRETPGMGFIAPFVRAASNILRYTAEQMPGISRLTPGARRRLAQGGEEAAEQRTREAVTGLLSMWAVSKWTEGTLTGAGPSDPKRRRVWLETHQPYSIKVGDEWISYQKFDPLAFPLGIMADAAQALTEASDQTGQHHSTYRRIEDALFAGIAGMTKALTNRHYVEQLVGFGSAVAEGSVWKAKRVASNTLSGFIPASSFLRTMNPDDYYREGRNILEDAVQGVPHFSEKIPPKFNLYGEPVEKAPGVINRGVNPFRVDDAKEDPVVEVLYELKRSMSAPDPTLRNKLNLLDGAWKERPDQPLPYLRWMQILRGENAKGEKVAPSLREKLAAEVQDPDFDSRSGGTDLFPGGEKFERLKTVADRALLRARRDMLEEYPRLRQAWRKLIRAEREALRSEQGPSDISELLEPVLEQ